MACLVEKELSGWTQPEGCGQRLHVQVGACDEWLPQGSVLGLEPFSICQ